MNTTNIQKQRPDNFMVWAMLSVLFYIPTGIWAVVCAHHVDTLWYEGEYEESIEAMKNARKYAYISFGIGFFMALVCMLFGFSGLLFAQLLLIALYVTFVVTNIFSGIAAALAPFVWIGAIAFLCWLVPILFHFCFG